MLKTKKQVKNGEWFRDQIRAFLIRNGATEQLNKAYEFVIITKMGTLQVSVYPDWIACRFDDVERAVAVIGRHGMNPCSGKWNHLFDQSYFQSKEMASRAVATFEADLTRYLPDPPLPGEGTVP
jgi:hypothetical protein